MNGSSGKENAWENWIKFFLWKSCVDNLAMRSLPMKRAGLGGHSRMVRGFDIHVAAADVSLTDASLRSNTLTSQDLTSLTSTSTSMVPTLMSMYLLLIQHVQYSLLRQLFHLLCQASGLPGLVRLTWRVPGQICYTLILVQDLFLILVQDAVLICGRLEIAMYGGPLYDLKN